LIRKSIREMPLALLRKGVKAGSKVKRSFGRNGILPYVGGIECVPIIPQRLSHPCTGTSNLIATLWKAHLLKPEARRRAVQQPEQRQSSSS
jgi:hypothetical protein